MKFSKLCLRFPTSFWSHLPKLGYIVTWSHLPPISYMVIGSQFLFLTLLDLVPYQMSLPPQHLLPPSHPRDNELIYDVITMDWRKAYGHASFPVPLPKSSSRLLFYQPKEQESKIREARRVLHAGQSWGLGSSNWGCAEMPEVLLIIRKVWGKKQDQAYHPGYQLRPGPSVRLIDDLFLLVWAPSMSPTWQWH